MLKISHPKLLRIVPIVICLPLALLATLLLLGCGQSSSSPTITPVITTVAGNGTAGYSGDNGPATSAELNSPSGVAVDSAGNLYIADLANERIRKVTF
jgi:NHL repeat